MPLAVLDALFIAFVAVQATVLFGGHAHVLETEGLTVRGVRAAGVLAAAVGVGADAAGADAVVIRVARRRRPAPTAGLLRIARRNAVRRLRLWWSISAIHRMWLYQQAYGFSAQRLMVITIELWLGAVFVLIAAGGYPDERQAVAALRAVAGAPVRVAPAGAGRVQPGAADRRPQHRPL